MAEPVDVETYRFTPEDLAPDRRLPGISAFMRVKNGADFIEAAIRSHLPHFDEIVVVMNQCTDATPTIVARLAAEFGPRLPSFRYLPKVFPPGSEGHARTPADSPESLVNYYNFALTRTRYRIATKLDDDHIAMPSRLARLTAEMRRRDYRLRDLLCFSGINLARDASNRLGVYAAEPFAGTGDHWFFEVGSDTYFVHDPRFERLRRGHRRRVFGDLAYWHTKYLKTEFGFGGYGIAEDGNRRYEAKQRAFLANRGIFALADLPDHAPRATQLLAFLPLPEKQRLKVDRWRAILAAPPGEAELAEAALRG